MHPAEEPCTCWWAKSSTGESHPAAWLSQHDRVAVTSKNGLRVEGRPAGMLWFESGGENVAPGFCIELDDESEAHLRLEEIATITPLRTMDRSAAVSLVTQALAHPFAIPEGGTESVVVIGDHDVVEVSVVRRHLTCVSTSPPQPSAVFVIG